MHTPTCTGKQTGVVLPCWTLWTLPPMWSDASRIVTSVKPFSSNVFAAARPAKPAPTTTIRGCGKMRRPLLRGSSVLSEEMSQLCMPSNLLFDWFCERQIMKQPHNINIKSQNLQLITSYISYQICFLLLDHEDLKDCQNKLCFLCKSVISCYEQKFFWGDLFETPF